jgi:hypothetical protein
MAETVVNVEMDITTFQLADRLGYVCFSLMKIVLQFEIMYRFHNALNYIWLMYFNVISRYYIHLLIHFIVPFLHTIIERRLFYSTVLGLYTV